MCVLPCVRVRVLISLSPPPPPPPPTHTHPTKTCTTLVPIFAKKGVFSQWEARLREIKKGVIFAGTSPRNFEKGVKFGMYLLPFVCSACLNSYAQMYLSFNHNLEVMTNTMYIEKCLEFDAVTYILTFTRRVL